MKATSDALNLATLCVGTTLMSVTFLMADAAVTFGASSTQAPNSAAGEQLFPEWATAAASRAATLQATGVVFSIDPTHSSISVQHGPIQNMGWPVWMKVRYMIPKGPLVKDISVGDEVTIEFRKSGTDFLVTALRLNSKRGERDQ